MLTSRDPRGGKRDKQKDNDHVGDGNHESATAEDEDYR